MSDERKGMELNKEELLEWLIHWIRECSGVDINERKGKSFCLDCNFKPSCVKANEQIKQLIQQRPTVDEKYVEEKAMKFYEKLYPHLGIDLDMLEIIEEFITQIISEVKGRQVEMNEDIIKDYSNEEYCAEYMREHVKNKLLKKDKT